MTSKISHSERNESEASPFCSDTVSSVLLESAHCCGGQWNVWGEFTVFFINHTIVLL